MVRPTTAPTTTSDSVGLVLFRSRSRPLFRKRNDSSRNLFDSVSRHFITLGTKYPFSESDMTLSQLPDHHVARWLAGWLLRTYPSGRHQSPHSPSRPHVCYLIAFTGINYKKTHTMWTCQRSSAVRIYNRLVDDDPRTTILLTLVPHHQVRLSLLQTCTFSHSSPWHSAPQHRQINMRLPQ
jgi:hypothetical protein